MEARRCSLDAGLDLIRRDKEVRPRPSKPKTKAVASRCVEPRVGRATMVVLVDCGPPQPNSNSFSQLGFGTFLNKSGPRFTPQRPAESTLGGCRPPQPPLFAQARHKYVWRAFCCPRQVTKCLPTHCASHLSHPGLIGGTDGCISASIGAVLAAKRTWSLPEIAPGSVCLRSAERSAWWDGLMRSR